MDYNTAYGLLGIADAANPFGFTEEEKLALGISESQRTGQGYKYNSATGSTDLYEIPADVVSHLGNGNSDAGAQNLYSMMDRIRQDRTGTTKQGKQIDPNKYLA
jgi:hypothetical protein